MHILVIPFTSIVNYSKMRTSIQVILILVELAACLSFRFIKGENTISFRPRKVLKMNSETKIRTFTSYVVYKGKGALSVKIVPPSYVMLSPQSRNLNREGGVLLEFAGPTSKPREYDWTKKGTFLLDATECAELSVVSQSVKSGTEFVHDPSMGTEKAGQITKRVKILPTQDGKGYFVSLSVNDKTGTAPLTTSFSLPVSNAEIEVIRQILVYSVPRILGFDNVWNNPGLGDKFDGEMPPSPPNAPAWKDVS